MSDDRMTPTGEPITPVEGEDQAATATEEAGDATPVETDIAPDLQIVAPEESAASESVTEAPQLEAAEPQPAAPQTPEEFVVEHAAVEGEAPLEQLQEAEANVPPMPEEQPGEAEAVQLEVPEAPAAAELQPTPTAPQTFSEPVSAQHPAPKMDDQAEFEAALNAFEGESTGTSYDDVFRPLTRGELITARVIQVDEKRVFVDLGTKAEGIVPIEELAIGNIENAHDVVKVGDVISVVVLNPQGREGHPIVSRKRAEFESTWDRIVQEFEKKETVSALVTERVKGGLVVDLGVRGFVPATHVGTGQIRNLDRFVGQSLPFKIIEVDRERRKVVLSNRLAEEEVRESKKQELFSSVKPGDVLDGTVRRLVDYGAFVDLGGVDGLLHVSEISWSRVDHPKEVLKEGDNVRVMVLRLDANSGRISLGRRQVLPDPWTGIKDNYRIGQTLTLPISRLVQSGAFVKLPEGAEAFIPISEMAHRRINKPSEVVSAGQEVELKVLDLRPDERRMVLSLRAMQPFEDRQQHTGGRDEIRSKSERRRERGPTTSGGQASLTIGDRLGALKGLVGTFGDDEEAEMEAPKPKKAKAEKPAEEALAAEEAVVSESAPEAPPAEEAVPIEAAPGVEEVAPANEEAPAEAVAEETEESVEEAAAEEAAQEPEEVKAE
ncbi:MAG: 30S ribosomal protein S1 [Armatimonadota bacterium]|nr:30S ribosomal protein S1 [Armatimonadota bacterium]